MSEPRPASDPPTPASSPTSHTADGREHVETVEVIVIGMGPGGEVVAHRLVDAGLTVVGVEAGLVGGECPFWGCIPSKMMVRAGDLLAEARRLPELAGDVEHDWRVEPAWDPVARRIRATTNDWDDTDRARRFTAKGGVLVRGRGRLIAPDTVAVSDRTDDGTGDGRADRRFRATRAIVVATGTTAAIPPIDGLDGTPYWTNREAVTVEQLPASLVVLGAGPIGAELAQVFARFGVRVTVVEAAAHLLPQEDPVAGEVLARVFDAEGIEVVTGTPAASVRHDEHGFTLTLEDGRTLMAERLLVAAGRHVELAGIGADVLGVDPDAGSLPTDDALRVRVPSGDQPGIWAVGDVTGRGPFTHTAIHQTKIVIASVLGEPHITADRAAVPRVTFTDPEVGSVGMTPAAARDAGIDVVVGRADVPDTARGWLHGPGNDGVIQLVADRARDVLVGAVAVGPAGGEVLGMLTLAVHAATPLEELRSMMYAYPTFHRGVEDALRDLDEQRAG